MSHVFVIETIENGRFKVLWKGYFNPFFDMSREEIVEALREKFGEGWYQVYKFENLGGNKWGRTTIFRGIVR